MAADIGTPYQSADDVLELLANATGCILLDSTVLFSRTNQLTGMQQALGYALEPLDEQASKAIIEILTEKLETLIDHCKDLRTNLSALQPKLFA
jgi:hypothetical protein